MTARAARPFLLSLSQPSSPRSSGRRLLPPRRTPNTNGGVAVDQVFQVGDVDNVNLFNGSLTVAIPKKRSGDAPPSL